MRHDDGFVRRRNPLIEPDVFGLGSGFNRIEMSVRIVSQPDGIEPADVDPDDFVFRVGSASCVALAYPLVPVSDHGDYYAESRNPGPWKALQSLS